MVEFRAAMGFLRAQDRATPLFWCILVVLFIAAVPAAAYTDPGSGLLIWQMAGAFFVGCVYQVRKFLIRLRKRK